jgi:hypothetical protein
MKPAYAIILLLALTFSGCSSEPSLQKYFVEKTENKNFIALDVSPAILNLDAQKLTPEESKALATFDKMNILAFKANESNKAEFEAEKTKVKAILKDEKYQELMKVNMGAKGGGSLSFVGDESHIEEFILFANQKETGFAVVRILGKDMDPNAVMTLMSMLKKSDVDMEQLKPLTEMMSKQ